MITQKNKALIKQQERFTEFDDLVNALQTKYTISMRDVCQELKCSRSWASDYIRPFVDAVFLSNGYGEQADWLSLVNTRLQRNSKDLVFLNEKQYRQYVVSHIKACEKRSKHICFPFFLKEKDYEEYCIYVFNFCLRFQGIKYETTGDEEHDKKAYEEYRKNLDALYSEWHNKILKYLPENLIILVEKHSLVTTKRTEVDWIQVPMIDIPNLDAISKWKAIHDMKDYGDTDEPFYRQLFYDGAIRLTVALNKKDGAVSKKIYYVDDPEVQKPSEEFNKVYDELLNKLRPVPKPKYNETPEEQDIRYRAEYKQRKLDRAFWSMNIFIVKESEWQKVDVELKFE